MSGKIKIDDRDRTLAIEVNLVFLDGLVFLLLILFFLPELDAVYSFAQVKMPQDASSSTVRDTRGLSGLVLKHSLTGCPFICVFMKS